MSVDPVTVGVKLALTAASMAFTATQRFEGPRLDGLGVSTAAYGTPYPYIWGYRRVDGCIISWAEELREKKVESKTKGGKYTSYRYFFTGFAVAAGHEIDAIAKIRMNNHLVYDMTSPGPVSPIAGFFLGLQGSPVKLTDGKNLRIYLGTEDQEIDPRYAAWCEDRYGPDSATARRGIAGAMFEDIPLDKLGNVPPQISMDVVNNGSPNYLWDTTPVTTDDGVVFSLDYSRFIADGWIWDTATGARLVPISGPAEAMGTGGTFYRHVPDVLRIYTNDGTHLVSVDTPAFLDRAITARGIHGDFVGITPFASTSSNFRYLSGATIETINVGFSVSTMEGDSNGNVWICGRPSGVSEVHLYCVSGPRQGDNHIIDTADLSAECYVWINSRDDFVVMQNANVWRLDSNFDLIDTSTITGNGTYSHVPGSDYVYRSVSGGTGRYNLISLTEDKFYDISDFVGAPNMSDAVYDPVNHAMVRNSGTLLARYFLDRIGGDGITLADIVSDICVMAGIDTDDFDVTDLTQTVIGYSTIQGPAADMIAPLLEIHDVDAVPHDFGIKFRTRGAAADELIESEQFHSQDGKRFELSIIPDIQLPVRVEFNYVDHTADQQPNTASDSLPLSSADSQRKKVFDLTTYASEPNEAQPLVERYLRRQWFEREPGDAVLDITWLKLEPGDVKSVDIDGEQRAIRITEITRSGLLVMAKWVRDDPRIHDQNASAGPTFDGRDDEVIFVPSPTKAVVMDIPYLYDSEAEINPQLHIGAGNYGAGNWPGAIFWEAESENGTYEQWADVEPSEKAVWGYCAEALGDANPWLWDRGNTVTITVKGGALTSVTESDIDADPTLNQAAIGTAGRWEIVNFTTANYLGDDQYAVSGFKRGRRGTEWAVELHEAGDEFWLAEDLSAEALGLSEVGTELFFRGETVGRDAALAPTINFEFEGETLKPYAPARLKWSTDGTDLFGEIIRRTRIGGAWVGGSTIPLSENSEEYEVDIMDGVDVVRTITVTGTNTFTYTAAQISADGNSVSSPPDTNVYQMSDAVGRGFALAA